MMNNLGTFGWDGLPAWGQLGFILLMVWSLFWKGLALWHSARRTDKIWFIALLIINTMGIAEIVYLFLIAKIKPNELLKLNKK